MTATSDRTYYHKVYKITHYQYLILHNREFRRTLQVNDVGVYLCLHCITVNNNNNTKNYFFLSEKCFPYFFHVHLNIHHKVVGTRY
jgi:hypothetical protein